MIKSELSQPIPREHECKHMLYPSEAVRGKRSSVIKLCDHQMEVGLQRERRLCGLIRAGMDWGINHAGNNKLVSVLVHQGPSET